MKITIPTIGTRGDVQPYMALALGLQEAGHTVTLASHPVMQSLVTSYDIPFAPMGPDINLGQETAVIRGRSRHWLLGFMRVMRFTFKMLEAAHTDLLPLCRQADLVIVAHSGAGSMEAGAFDLPTASVTLFPQAIPVTDPAQPPLRRLFGKLAGAGMGLLMTRPLNQIRKRVGLRPMGPTGITSSHLNLIPISPLVAPPDPRWEARHQVVGYWFTGEMPDWTPPTSLQAFLAGGEQGTTNFHAQLCNSKLRSLANPIRESTLFAEAKRLLSLNNPRGKTTLLHISASIWLVLSLA
jgi:sterol 3beta-glucosyltransferase